MPPAGLGPRFPGGPGTAPIPGPGRIGKRGISRFPIPAESGIGDSLPVSRPNRESGEQELGTSGSGRHHPPSAGPWQFKKEGGGRPESSFEGLKATSSPGSCLLYSHPQGITSPISRRRFAANCTQSGNGGFPNSRFRLSRESGTPCPFPGQIGNRGNGNWGFPGLTSDAAPRVPKRPVPTRSGLHPSHRTSFPRFEAEGGEMRENSPRRVACARGLSSWVPACRDQPPDSDQCYNSESVPKLETEGRWCE